MISVSIRPLEFTLCPCDSVRALNCGRWPRPLPPPSAGRRLGGLAGGLALRRPAFRCRAAASRQLRAVSFSWPPRLYVTVTQCRVAEVDQACGLGSADHL